ncbi:YegS/Rv2252/BmrU family lipid kinase [Nocardia sp. alder85J]|uniref:YegS/Rv2252/BmrU family lipid kinase n=1 Tax=Nocardia sp. alder85J TaxID=2862949 RepID=UPI001CD4229A|nr:YegS/Rv2252/BmrU family lipid kinase [Nocardia sp. alder85J]MCX4097439.1 YegS/Rv2252/BmrU family lipid kinase [Nocardia sp. alder85J]
MPEIGSILLVTNPLSGHGKGLAAATAARARFEARGVRISELCGRTADETRRLVAAAVAAPAAPDAVVCAGGDGLICVVLQALAGSEIPLGLLPGGTGNDLARELGIPEQDPIAAADIVCDGAVRTIDLGVVETADHLLAPPETGSVERDFGDPAPTVIRFATVAATGFDARVTLRANRMRRPKGSLRYSLAAVFELAGRLAVPYRIELAEDAVQVEPAGTPAAGLALEAVMVAVGNTRSYGGGMLICPDATVDDGLLEVTVVGAMSRREMTRLLPALAAGRRIEHPAITRYRSRSVRIAAAAPVTADGEPIGMLPATFRALPAARRMLVPVRTA